MRPFEKNGRIREHIPSTFYWQSLVEGGRHGGAGEVQLEKVALALAYSSRCSMEEERFNFWNKKECLPRVYIENAAVLFGTDAT